MIFWLPFIAFSTDLIAFVSFGVLSDHVPIFRKECSCKLMQHFELKSIGIYWDLGRYTFQHVFSYIKKIANEEST